MVAWHGTATWELLDGRLADDEEVWVELGGSGGRAVVGTDRRLIEVADGRVNVDWPWEEVDDVSPSGTGSTIRIRRRDRTAEIVLDPVGDSGTVMQSVTILALLAVDAARYGARIGALRRSGARNGDESARP
ncbi:MAG TPA: hypothetical protein VFI28_08890 [Candidatus Limnocylindrales bacterium]|nr:hypothetical protein [Candidatus Limnocylindrales bacterium]